MENRKPIAIVDEIPEVKEAWAALELASKEVNGKIAKLKAEADKLGEAFQKERTRHWNKIEEVLQAKLPSDYSGKYDLQYDEGCIYAVPKGTQGHGLLDLIKRLTGVSDLQMVDMSDAMEDKESPVIH